MSDSNMHLIYNQVNTPKFGFKILVLLDMELQ